MTTEIKEVESINLAWDAFLNKETGVPQERAARDRQSRNLRQMIDGFRHAEWPNIKRELKQTYHWEVEDGLEPHWVAPGRAVFWQEQLVRQVVVETDSEGHTTYRPIFVSQGWQPISPEGAPANNASQIAMQLERGLRFRPPRNGVGVETFLEAASLSEEPRTEPPPSRFYPCARPHPGKRLSGAMRFNSWKAYMQHCIRYQEPPEHQPPKHVLDAIQHFKFWCHMHGRGFNNEKLAAHHIRLEMKKPGRPFHPSITEMATTLGQGG